MKKYLVIALTVLSMVGGPVLAKEPWIQVRTGEEGTTLERDKGDRVVFGSRLTRQDVRTFYSEGKKSVVICTWAQHRETFSHFTIFEKGTVTEGGDSIPAGKCGTV